MPSDENQPKRQSELRSFLETAPLRSILETVPDAMTVIDEGGRILSLSLAAERMFGFKEEELLGENVSTLMPSRSARQSRWSH
jgi:two-component system, LuxR family, sensor kinase FixL